MTEEETAKKEKKAPPANLVIPPKKPKLSKAERRALQEKQRAEKAASQQDPRSSGGMQPQPPPPEPNVESLVSNAPAPKSAKSQAAAPEESEKAPKANDKTIDLFSHLPQYQDLPNPHAEEFTSTLHPAVIQLGMEYALGQKRGGNTRCRAMLQVFSTVLEDYFPPEDATDYRSHFDQFVLKPSFTFWTTRCRPHSVSMGNAFTFLKTAVASLSRDLPLAEAKEILQETIERYLLERLEYASRAIAQHAMAKIEDGDVVLTFGNSETISVLLTTAKEKGVQFYVWVVDSRPLWEGKGMLQTLRQADISCGYIQLNALTYVMQQVTKVFLGASALMSNGSIYGRIGTAGVALLAKDKHIPVLVCCESYKISNKVQLESITQNELGNPDALIHGESLANWKEIPNLKLLNLLYDVTPAEFVSGIVTEVGIIPPTSIAVLLREMNPQDAAY
mmetsp:Transcript_101959/g.285778  ORF Transcript_101959/g.285778 Transcript_101959/m.285778 type:complete len:448 (+) Transcript_101959:46-1389(+)